MAGPIDLAPIITRLQAEVDGLRLIGGAADRAAVKRIPTQLPAAFVLDGRETAEPPKGGSSQVVQRVRASFGVLLCTRHYRASERGAAGRDAERDVIGQVREALMGWTPAQDQATEPTTSVQLVSGELLAYDDQVRWWLETYRLEYWSRK